MVEDKLSQKRLLQSPEDNSLVVQVNPQIDDAEGINASDVDIRCTEKKYNKNGCNVITEIDEYDAIHLNSSMKGEELQEEDAT